VKLFAQHGASEGEKITEGFARGLLDGVIYSPRDVSLASLQEKLSGVEMSFQTAERLFDPQYYSIFLNGTAEARLGWLLEEDYASYFQPRRRSQLERESQIEKELTTALTFQSGLNVTGIIAPNILIPNSLNSIESVISKNFIRLAKSQYAALNDKRPVYATLAISRNALMDKQELVDFINEITLLDNPPDGFYVLVSARNTEARSDIYNADVIAAWMFINHTLTVNGFKVINGYSDIMTPFLGVAGGAAGAFGWWSNLKVFSLDRFAPSAGGGRLPIQRYLSLALLNRITFFEFNQLRTIFPAIVNNLDGDALYDPESASEPQRNMEVVQSWEAVKALSARLVETDQAKALKRCNDAIKQAGQIYEAIKARGVRPDPKSNDEHIQPLTDGLGLFKKLAEL
jgi:hypothetical protein